MSATIIPFPNAWSYPADWSAHEQYLFDYEREKGTSIEEGVKMIESLLWIHRVVPGEGHMDRLWRIAAESIKLCPEKK